MFSLWAMVRNVRQWFSHSAAVEMVVNGVLRTLWVGVGAAKNHMREAKPLMNIPQRAMHAQCETLMDINGFGGHSC